MAALWTSPSARRAVQQVPYARAPANSPPLPTNFPPTPLLL